MANDSDKIRFAPNGALYIAPTSVSLVLPEATDSGAAPAGYKALGYVTDAGVTITPTIETNPLGAWQSAVPVLYNVTSASFTISATLLEANKLVTETFFGATWVALTDETSQPTGEYRLDLSSVPELAEFSLVVDWSYKGNHSRAVIGRAMISERGAISLQRTEAQQYELTISALDSNGQLAYLLTDEEMTDTP